jgi:hypothetical protein
MGGLPPPDPKFNQLGGVVHAPPGAAKLLRAAGMRWTNGRAGREGAGGVIRKLLCKSQGHHHKRCAGTPPPKSCAAPGHPGCQPRASAAGRRPSRRAGLRGCGCRGPSDAHDARRRRVAARPAARRGRREGRRGADDGRLPDGGGARVRPGGGREHPPRARQLRGARRRDPLPVRRAGAGLADARHLRLRVRPAPACRCGEAGQARGQRGGRGVGGGACGRGPKRARVGQAPHATMHQYAPPSVSLTCDREGDRAHAALRGVRGERGRAARGVRSEPGNAEPREVRASAGHALSLRAQATRHAPRHGARNVARARDQRPSMAVNPGGAGGGLTSALDTVAVMFVGAPGGGQV